jgi:hypothetical protein
MYVHFTSNILMAMSDTLESYVSKSVQVRVITQFEIDLDKVIEWSLSPCEEYKYAHGRGIKIPSQSFDKRMHNFNETVLLLLLLLERQYE